MMPLIAYEHKDFKGPTLDVIDQANTILRDYEQQGYDLTLRQLYYQFVARGLIPNSDREYNRLGSIVNQARMSGLIDWHHIVDRTRFLRSVSSWDSPASIIRGAARGYQRDLWETQDVRVEVWIEKDALVGVVERACEDLRLPFLSCRGYTSQSEMWGAAQRFGSYLTENKSVVVLHLGDHDPSGIDMTRDIEDRLRTFLANDYYGGRFGDIDNDLGEGAEAEDVFEWVGDRFRVDRLALNWDQVQQYQPPPNPAKMTDSRGAGYVEKFGRQSWELDALEPTVMGDLIRDAVRDLRDPNAWALAEEQEREEREGLTLASSRWPAVVRFLNGDAS